MTSRGRALAFYNRCGFNGDTLSDIYNNRPQPYRVLASTASTVPSTCGDTSHTGNVLDLTYSFSAANQDPDNNGNVLGITNNRDTTRSQYFA